VPVIVVTGKLKMAASDSQEVEQAPIAEHMIERSGGVSLSSWGEVHLVRLSGSIDIDSAAELKRLLLRGLESCRAVHVSLEGVLSLDITVLQLLWAAKRHARQAGMEFTIRGGSTPPITSFLTEVGMDELELLA